MKPLPSKLKPFFTPGARVVETGESAWRLEISPGIRNRYRVAQLDDYGSAPRRAFPWQPPFHLELHSRASDPAIPGTWGFGLWNDPFSMTLLSGAEVLRLPALPNAVWFFHATPPSYLSLRDDLPAQGWLAATFRSAPLPPSLLALSAPALPLLAVPPTVRWVRRQARRFVNQDATQIAVDVTLWHHYCLDWQATQVTFLVDDQVVLETAVSPLGPLGLVVWVDNQYLTFDPTGRVRFGKLPSLGPAWIEVRELLCLTSP